MERNNVATITFRTASQLALFTNELDGQISDGHWENSGPREHWVFWHSLDHAVGPDAGIKTNEHYRSWDRTGCKKNNYNFMSAELLECVQDRMLKTGRLAQCLSTDDIKVFLEKVSGADYLPDTLEGYEQFLATGKLEYEFAVPYINRLTQAEARKYYETKYTEKDLHKDLREIKKVCKTIAVCR